MTIIFMQAIGRLLFGKNLSYLPNDTLVTLLNLCLEKSSLHHSKDGTFWKTIQRILGWHAEALSFDRIGINPENVIDMLRRRVEESHKFLEGKGKSLDLTKCKVYHFYNRKWRRVKGKSVTKSPFGLWINKKRISKLIGTNVLACERGNEGRSRF